MSCGGGGIGLDRVLLFIWAWVHFNCARQPIEISPCISDFPDC
jgi:hypothetical protein